MNKNEHCTLREVFESNYETLKKSGLKRNDQNLSLLDDEEKQIGDNVDLLMGLQKSSRDLLAMTSPRLIKEFKIVKQEYAQVCENYEKAFESGLCVDLPKISEIKEVFDRFGKNRRKVANKHREKRRKAKTE